MFDYNSLTYSEKISKLMDFHGSQGKLSDHLNVSRQSIMRWKEDDTSIKEESLIKIDVAFCEAFGLESVSANEVVEIMAKLQEIDFSYFNVSEEHIIDSISRFTAFGSLEIEESNITEKKFNKVVLENELINDLALREIYSVNSLRPKGRSFLTSNF